MRVFTPAASATRQAARADLRDLFCGLTYSTNSSLFVSHSCLVSRTHTTAHARAAVHRTLTVRGDMVIFKNAKNTQTTAWRVLTEPTEDTCKALASVEAPTLRNTYDFPPIFPNLAAISLLPLSKRLTPYLPRHPAVVK